MAATLLGFLLYALFVLPPAPLSLREVDATVDEALAAITPMPAYSAHVYQVIRPSLVLIQVAKPGKEDGEGEENEGSGGLGSGIVIDANASILTSLHVVTNTTAITVTFADGTESRAQIVEALPELDIAVLSPLVLPELLVPAVLGNPGALHVGDEAYAVGHPLGLYASMSAGVISGFDRIRDRRADDRRAPGSAEGADHSPTAGSAEGGRHGLCRPGAHGICRESRHRHAQAPIDRAEGVAALPHLRRRHAPFVLLLAALISLVVAVARPVAVVAVPTNQTSIILAIDVSRSMCSTDIAPNRLQAAKDAAWQFVDSQPPGTEIGIVAFAGFAEMVQPPTTDKGLLDDTIQSLLTGRRTAVGSAILKSIDAIAEGDPTVPMSERNASDPQATPVVAGAYTPNIIVLLTDGASNAGVLPLDAAQQATDRGIRVYTIGFGTAAGGRMDCGQFDGFEPFAGSWGGGGGGGGGFRRGIDEETLIQVSDMTGGEYYSAESATELQAVFRGLPTYWVTGYETTEVSASFAGLAGLLMVLAVGLSMRWNPLL